MIRILVNITMWLSVSLVLQACSSFEVVSKVPTYTGTVKIKEQDLSLFEKPIHIFNPVNLELKVATLQSLPRVDNIILLIDRSSEEHRTYRGVPADIYSTELFRRLLLTLPDQFNLYAGIVERLDTSPIQPLSKLNKNMILNSRSSVADLPVIGVDLFSALQSLDTALHNIKGSVAIITIAGWEQFTPIVVSTLSRIKQHRDFTAGKTISESTDQWADPSIEGLCLFQLGLGNKLSSSVVGELGGCVASKAADQIFQPEDMAGFIESYLFSFPEDSDGDGIPNYRDQCPKSVGKPVVDYSGCSVFKLNRDS